MIIKSLEMYNFRQFIGDQKIEFSSDPEKNVTVLIGVNTSGKTTLIRAFEWCLYEKINFDDKVLLNNEVRLKMHEGETQDTWVSIEFIHDDITYTLTRKYRYLCNSRRTENGEVVVELNKKPEKDVKLEYLQKDGQTKTPIDDTNIKKSIDRVLPEDLSDYFFFGGERISNIANRTDLSKAVRGLMRLDVLENARDHLSQALKGTKDIKGFNQMIDTTGNEAAQKARDTISTCNERKKVLEDEMANAAKQRDYWKEKENEYNAQLAKSNIEAVKAAKIKRDQITSAINQANRDLEEARKAYKDAFNKRPYAFFGLKEINKALSLLEDVKDETEGVPGMNQDAIDYLIHVRHRCICGTELREGTVPYNLVMAERGKLPPEKIGTVVMNFKNKAEGYLAGNEDYYETIDRRLKDIRIVKRRIGQLRDEFDEQSKLIIDDTDAKAIEEKRRDAHRQYQENLNDYNQAHDEIVKCNTNIENCEKAIEKYAKSSKKNQRVARYIAYAEKVLEWLTSTYESKESVVREQLQKRVNDNFSKMYHGERTIRIDDKYRVKYSDVKTEESDGLKAVKSFAFIASLVSMAKDKILDEEDMKFGQVYPLVMDAPFSNVDEIHIDNICKILPETANQVIMAVMQKDWEYAERELKNRVGISYSIHKDTDASGKEIDTSTHVKKEATYV